ncbi:glycosyltransferase family 4 protein [Desulfovibrio ferrophilus]|uniref:Glycosyltransferase n=1 Tax=Desulfovibrio ferrophilus TaxID=241368 RepID=A0A2Z6AUR1_9BACT|nr:glycosyltransferase family 4 protein [Desulfovibrio ferrophilus]BBD06971.1 glycosyltransferase [Desulfovibrio ferrophilus]
MRIIQVANVRWFNATSWYALYLARLLQDAGHESLVLTLEDTESHAKAQEWNLDVRTLPLNSSNPLKVAHVYRELSQLVTEFKPHAVNCHRGESFWLWSLLKKRSNSFRLIRTRGDQRLPKHDPINRWLHASVADAVIATNSVMYGHFREHFPIRDCNLHRILGGVDRARFAFSVDGRARVRAEFGFGEDDLVVGLLGRFDEVKGQRELIQAIASLRADGNVHLKLMLAGFPTATTQEQVQNWINDSGMSDATVITGSRRDVADIISAMDLGVIASKWSETIARAALEIMSCGVPLIGTTVGVMPDLISGRALFPPNSVKNMAESIAWAQPESTRRGLVSQQAKTMENLSGEAFLERTLAVYRGEPS